LWYQSVARKHCLTLIFTTSSQGIIPCFTKFESSLACKQENLFRALEINFFKAHFNIILQYRTRLPIMLSFRNLYLQSLNIYNKLVSYKGCRYYENACFYHVTIFLSGELLKTFRYISYKSHSTDKDQNHKSWGTCVVASVPHTKFNRNLLSSCGAHACGSADRHDVITTVSWSVRTLEKTQKCLIRKTAIK
jgi:hypothetical protein